MFRLRQKMQNYIIVSKGEMKIKKVRGLLRVIGMYEYKYSEVLEYNFQNETIVRPFFL